jgi:pimeloyl-ACP methyl ester carboxylesterase
VLLIGGFALPPWSLTQLARALRGAGHRVDIAPTGLNLDCGEATVARLLDRIDSPTTIVGHSRGGQLGLVAAVRRPALVGGLVTVGTPWTVGPPDSPGVRVAARAIRALHAHGVRALPSIDCATAACCTRFRDDLRLKPAARWVALWSSADRIAGRDSVPPSRADEAVDVGGGHLGLVTHDPGIGAVVDAVARVG